MSPRYFIWQCQDECCADKPYSKRWWNFRQTEPVFIGGVDSEGSFTLALRAVSDILKEGIAA